MGSLRLFLWCIVVERLGKCYVLLWLGRWSWNQPQCCTQNPHRSGMCRFSRPQSGIIDCHVCFQSPEFPSSGSDNQSDITKKKLLEIRKLWVKYGYIPVLALLQWAGTNDMVKIPLKKIICHINSLVKVTLLRELLFLGQLKIRFYWLKTFCCKNFLFLKPYMHVTPGISWKNVFIILWYINVKYKLSFLPFTCKKHNIEKGKIL